MVNNAKENLSGVKNILVDASYTGGNFATQIKDFIGAAVEVIKRSEFEQALTKYTKKFTINVQRDKLKTVYSSVAQW